MSFTDFSKTRPRVTRITKNSNYGKLVLASVDRIHALKYFRYVGVLIRPKQTMQAPSCIVLPRSVEVLEQQLSAGIFHYEYGIELGIAVKGPNDCILFQELLGLAAKLRNSFSVGDTSPVLTFDSVTGHFNTRVGSTPVTLLEELGHETLLFSSGVIVNFDVRTKQE